MSVSTRLLRNELTVDPGGEVLCDIAVQNTGTIVDEYFFEVLGDAAAWAEVGPASLPLYPGAQGDAQIVFRPPRASTTPARSIPFAVRVRSRQEPNGMAVEEGVLHVTPFLETAADLQPIMSHGRLRARHEVGLDNRGNVGLNAEVVATDPSKELRFRVRPPALVAGPGAAAIGHVTVRPAHHFWRGAPKARPFEVHVRPREGGPFVLAGTYLQEALVPGWLPAVAAVLIALLVAGGLLWALVLKPAVQSAAQDSAKQAVNSALAGPVAQVKAQGDQQAAAIQQLQQKSGLPTLAPTTPTPGFPTSTTGTPTDGRLQQGQLSATIPDKTAFSLTDLVFENPNGDTGQIQLERVAANGTVSVLLNPKLDNFRDLDYHFVAPVVLSAGQKLQLDISNCKPASGGQCGANVYYTGYRAATS